MTAISTSAMAIWLFFFAFDRNPAIDYGGPGDVYIQPPEIEGGQRALVCFKKVTWLRLCPTVLTEHIQIDGLRFDLIHPHFIHPPEMVGPLAPKCRELIIPPIPQGVSGAATYTAEAESMCGPFGGWLPIKNKIAPVPFAVKPAAK
jgi:hypothetical protein